MPTEFERNEVVFLVAAQLLVLVAVLNDLLALERIGVGRRWSDSMGPALNANCLLDIFLGDGGIFHARRQLRVGQWASHGRAEMGGRDYRQCKRNAEMHGDLSLANSRLSAALALGGVQGRRDAGRWLLVVN